MSSASNLRTTSSSDQFAAAYLKQGITHGITYQVKMLTWTTWKLLCDKDPSMKNWYLGTEVRSARGFHDLVIKYEVDKPAAGADRYVYRFVQIKHKLHLSDTSTIRIGSLASKQKKKQYSLIYLFRCFLTMIGEYEDIRLTQVLDLTVFTNVDMTTIDFLLPVDKDSIFGFEGKGRRYRVDIDLIRENAELMARLKQVTTSDAVIDNFLEKVVFAVDQPSESELEGQIVREIGRVYSVPQIFYDSLLKNILNWFLIIDNNGNAPYLTAKQALQYLLEAENTLTRAKTLDVHVNVQDCSLVEQLSRLRI